MSGEAIFKTSDEIFWEEPLAVDMLIDTLTDRGFQVSHEPINVHVPINMDLSTGKIECKVSKQHRFKIRFRVVDVRTESEDAWFSQIQKAPDKK